MILNDNFPASTRVLAIDSDPVSLTHIDSLLRNCQYDVTVANKATEAVELLKENKNKFDLIITEVDFPDMDDVFKLLQYVADVPFIMLSSNDNKELIMKCNAHGACDYLLKPIKMEVVKNMWQYVEKMNSRGEGGRLLEVCPKPYKKRKDGNILQNVNHQENLQQKKRRLVWTEGLHNKFTRAVDQLGLDNAVPKRILELMNDEKVTRENVASHLQKYRLYMKKNNERALANSDSDCKPSSFDNIRNMGSTGFSSYPVVGSDSKAIQWSVMNTQTRNQNHLHRVAFMQTDTTPQISKTAPTNYNYNNNVVSSGNLNVKVTRTITPRNCMFSEENQYLRRDHYPYNESSFVENSYMVLPYIQTDNFCYQKHQITPIAGCNMMNHNIHEKSSIFSQEVSSTPYSFGHEGNSLVVGHEVNHVLCTPEWPSLNDLDVYLNDSDEHTTTSS